MSERPETTDEQVDAMNEADELRNEAEAELEEQAKARGEWE